MRLFLHAERKKEEEKVKVMVPICKRQCRVTVCDGVSKSNINFSENAPTIRQAAGKLNI